MGQTLDFAGVIALLLLLAAGTLYSALLPSIPRFTDEQEYLKLSANLVHGPGFSMNGVNLTAARAPGYAFFLAVLRLVGGGYFIFRVAQFVLLGATIFLVARLGAGRQVPAGLLMATGLVGCYPVLFYTSATLYPQTVAGFLFIVALSFLLTTPRSLSLSVAAGVSFGALILVAPTFLFTLVVVVGVAGLMRIIRWREAAVVVVAAGLIVGSWTVRNVIYLDHFVPIATNAGLNLLEGNNAEANPEAAANVGMEPYYKKAGELQLDEFQCDHFYRTAALTWIETHPTDAFILYLKKVGNFFSLRNVYSLQAQPEISPWKEVIMGATYLFLLGLLGWRLVSLRRFPLNTREKLFLIVYVLSAFTSALFFTRIRHRLPYDYLIISIISLHLSSRLQSWLTPGAGIDESPREW